MSTQLINLNEDLKRLQCDGFNVSVIENNLVIKGIPYVNNKRKIQFGTIFCPLELSGMNTIRPHDHTVRFAGEYPCNQFGEENQSFVNSPQKFVLNQEIIGDYFLSSKPDGGYPDYYAKFTRYINLISAPAKSIDSSLTAANFEYKEYNETSVFNYPDTNTAKYGITALSGKLKEQKVAIVGLGGTGSFVLDFLSKTSVKQITIIDGDVMLNNNAFRIPGAMSLDDLKERQSKVIYLKSVYEKLRKGIVVHEEFLNETNVSLLQGHDFVFLAIDNPPAKKPIIDYLLAQRIPFVDLGMGLSVVDDSLRGTIRKTLVTATDTSYLNKIALEGNADDNVYSQNIQISELNALNAVLGIIAWKKWSGYYISADPIFNTSFILDEEEVVNAP